MLPFIGYHMGDYWSHWMDVGRSVSNPPRIFGVNWFRKDKNGKFIWPGFGENMRILQWIVEKVHGRTYAEESPLGWVPRYEDINWDGLDFSEDDFDEIMAVDRDIWEAEILSHEELFIKLYDRLPKEFMMLRQLTLSQLWRAPKHWEPTHVTAPYIE
jgi:phosphoenolpyruvate carboxykinase (GTP)